MRGVVKNHLALVAQDKGSMYHGVAPKAALYLYAYGNKADWLSASKIQLDIRKHWGDLVYLVEDPRPIVDTHLGLRGGGGLSYDFHGLARVLPALRDFPPALAKQYAQDFENSLIRVAIKRKIAQYGGARYSAMAARMQYGPAKSYCLPDDYAAEMALSRSKKWLSTDKSWLPRDWMHAELIEQLASGVMSLN